MERNKLEITLSVPEDFGRLSRDLELTIFRLVQECLTNIHRHSESESAAILITTEGENVVLQVQDAGKGIRPEKLSELRSQGGGVGIKGMRERVRQCEGRMDIESNSTGTKISFRFPVLKTPTPKSERRITNFRLFDNTFSGLR